MVKLKCNIFCHVTPLVSDSVSHDANEIVNSIPTFLCPDDQSDVQNDFLGSCNAIGASVSVL